MSLLISVLLMLLPQRLKPWAYRVTRGYEIAPGCRIGLTLIHRVERMVMRPGARIGALNVIKGLSLLEMGEGASIGVRNWITSPPRGSGLFAHVPDRNPVFRIGRESGVSQQHYIDCTGGVAIGAFANLAGNRSQIVSHSIDFRLGMQTAGMVEIGDYSFVATGCILIKGARLPPYCLLTAGSVLTRAGEQEWMIYRGNPAEPVREIARDSAYFTRTRGYVE